MQSVSVNDFIKACQENSTLLTPWKGNFPSLNNEGLSFKQWYNASVFGVNVKYPNMSCENAHIWMSKCLWFKGMCPGDWVSFNKNLFQEVN